MTTLRLALALIAGCTAAVFAYAILRGAQLLLFPEPNPALVIWSAHSGYVWRVWTCAYGGGMAAFIAYVAAERAPARVASFLVRALTIASALLFAQGLLLP